jgi:tripeptidyl-peptidase-1
VAPSYQTSEISSYFKSVSQQPEPGYNLTGRGYPDVSLLAHNYQVVIGGNIYSLDGTSASCPVFAGFLALINSARKKNNQSTVGFVQPLLYSTYTNWAIDITSGQNNCCATNSKGTVCCTEGFAASIGWDPVTGLGSANFAKLYASAMGQPIPTSSAVYSLSIPFYSFGVSMILYLFLGFN